MSVTIHKAGLPLRCLSALAVAFLATMSACTPEEEAEGVYTPEPGATADNALTEAETEEGWTLLFNGSDFSGWRGLGQDSIPIEHWQVVDGAVRKTPSGQVPVQADGQPLAGGDLMTEEVYKDFELSLDFKLTPGANSGIKYNVSEEMSAANPPGRAALGFEYQVLDDSLHPDAKEGVNGNRTLGGLYDMIPPNADKAVNPMGEWNHARILKQGNHIEHWLNGAMVVEYDLGSARFDSLLDASKYRDIAGFADNRDGHIVLQDHNDEVFYRNIKIRPLSPE